jgi:hypothetical protein
MNKLAKILALIAALCPAGTAFGAAIGLTPSSQIAATGDQVTLDLLATGLGDGTSPAVGSFDVDLLYDPGVLSFDPINYAIGIDLGSAIPGINVDSGTGIIDLSAISLESPSDLITSQGSTLQLASLVFDVLDLSLGASTTVDIDTNDPNLVLGDVSFAPISINSISPATIRNATASSIPLPGTPLLIVLGLVMLGLVVRADRYARFQS